MLPQTLQIHCYDVVSFVTEIEKAIKLGYCLDLYNVQNYPVQIGYQFITNMVKGEDEVKEVVESTLEEVTTPLEASESIQEDASTTEVTKDVVEAPKKAGRPAKAK